MGWSNVQRASVAASAKPWPSFACWSSLQSTYLSSALVNRVEGAAAGAGSAVGKALVVCRMDNRRPEKPAR